MDENLASLNTGQRVTDRLLDDLDQNYAALDHLLRGDPEKDTDGLISRLHNVENTLQELKVATLKNQIADIEVTKSKWEFSGRILERVLILAVALLLGWGKIAGLYHKVLAQKPDPLEQMIDRAKHPKDRYHRIVVKQDPGETE